MEKVFDAERGGLLVPEGTEPGSGAHATVTSQSILLPKNPLRIVRSGNFQREVVAALGKKLRSKAPEYRVSEVGERLEVVLESWLAPGPGLPPSAS